MLLFTIMLFVAVGFMMISLYLLRMQEKEMKNQQMEIYLLTIQELYDTFKMKIEEMRKYRHDLAKHIQTLEKMVDQQTGKNEIISSMLEVKAEECRKENISFSTYVGDGNYEKMEEIDMVGLLYNLLDNALEASRRVTESEKEIKVCIEQKGKFISIEVSNYFQKGEIIDFKTRKGDKESHGIGTKIIDDIVKKYEGKKQVDIDYKKQKIRKLILLKVE